ncbi:MAG: hypothetical protein ACOVK2_07015 [Candidatus Fonsibacter sp.]
MIDEYTLWWLGRVREHYLDEYCFHLPFTPKRLDEMTLEELELLEQSAWEFHNIPSEGLQFFICKRVL